MWTPFRCMKMIRRKPMCYYILWTIVIIQVNDLLLYSLDSLRNNLLNRIDHVKIFNLNIILQSKKHLMFWRLLICIWRTWTRFSGNSMFCILKLQKVDWIVSQPSLGQALIKVLVIQWLSYCGWVDSVSSYLLFLFLF